MTSSTSLLRLQMLSQLSLPENIFLAAFLSECHQYLNTVSNSYCFLDNKARLTDIYDELNHHALTEAVSSHLRHSAQLDSTSLLTEDYILTSQAKWLKSEYQKAYRHTFVRVGYHQSLILPVKKAGKPHGLLVFNRSRIENAFSTKDIKAASVIREALEEGLLYSQCQTKTTMGWRSGLIIVDNRGELTQCCPEGHNILTLALQKRAGSLQRSSFADVRNLPGVLEMIDRLLDSTTPMTNAEVNVSSLWGDFQINGFPIFDQGGHRAPQVYLNITWQVPFSLMLFHNIQYMCFTPRQQLIALLYASGESTKSIANKLELSLYTVKEHIQHIFEKLRIHSRSELIEHIICRECKTCIDELDQSQLHSTERPSVNVSRS